MDAFSGPNPTTYLAHRTVRDLRRSPNGVEDSSDLALPPVGRSSPCAKGAITTETR